MTFLWKTIFYNPLYNLLAFFIVISPGRDVGIAVVLLTLLVKIILFPLSKKAIVSQFKLKLLQPKIEKIKEEYTDKQLQAQKTFALYKEEGVNPFSSCAILLVQLPVLFALYYVFLSGLGSMTTAGLYSFMPKVDYLNTQFLGILDITKPSVIMSILAGLSQFFQLKYQPITQEKPQNEKDIQAMLAYNMSTQMKYILPIIITVVSLKLPAALALYWVVSNTVTLIQERTIKRSLAL